MSEESTDEKGNLCSCHRVGRAKSQATSVIRQRTLADVVELHENGMSLALKLVANDKKRSLRFANDPMLVDLQREVTSCGSYCYRGRLKRNDAFLLVERKKEAGRDENIKTRIGGGDDHDSMGSQRKGVAKYTLRWRGMNGREEQRRVS